MDATATSLLCTAISKQKSHAVMAKRTGKASAELIRSIPLFSNVLGETCSDLVAAAALRQFAARTILFKEGSRADNLYVVMQGSAELFSEHDERYCTLAVVPAVAPLALCAILSDRNPLSARVLEPSELIVVPADLVADLFGRDPEFAKAAIQELASKCHEMVENFKSHRLRSTIERVAHWMLRCDRKSGGTGRIVIPFDKRVLASYLGMAPEHLSRSFSALASAGVVVDGRNITLKDRAALSAAAGPSLPERI
jgi:CRP/FNR family transcriptional regulator, transcriptional activator FtrB